MQKEKESGIISIFELLGESDEIVVKYPNLPEYDNKVKLIKEKEVVGVYVTGHPLASYEQEFKKYSFSTMMLLNKETDDDGNLIAYVDVEDGMQVELGCIINDFKKLPTKSGLNMAIVNVEDMYGSIECVLFPKTYEKFSKNVEPESVVKISGRLQIRDGREPSIIVDKLLKFGEEDDATENGGGYKRPQQKPVVEAKKQQYLGLNVQKDDVQEILEILEAYPGEVTVIIKTDGKKYLVSQKIRNCRGLINELQSILDIKDIVFFEKQ